jgi:hypothetical protein
VLKFESFLARARSAAISSSSELWSIGGTDPLRQADSRFARAAGQIENLHSRQQTRVFNQRFCDGVTQNRRFGLPLL